MMGLLITLAVIALILSLLGFTGVAAALRSVAWFILLIAIILFVVAFIT
jgi:uncharacterized membrane protein YtjA (UPF0391 family)